MMSFQALLRDANGTPVDGPVTLSLTIVDSGGTQQDASGNGSIGPEDTFVVNGTANAGVVSIKYGPIAPACFSGAARFLRANVNTPALGQLNDVEIVTPPAIAEQLNARGTGNVALVTDATGKIGIGTSAPQATVDAVGTVRSQRFEVWNGSSGLELWNLGRVIPNAFGLESQNPHGLEIGVISGGPIAFYNGAGETARIGNDGKVGIGIIAPDFRLTVDSSGTGPFDAVFRAGSVRVYDSGSGYMNTEIGYNAWVFGGGNAVSGIGHNINWRYLGGPYFFKPQNGRSTWMQFNQDYMSFNTDVGTAAGSATLVSEVMRVTGTGDVGIGTATPAAQRPLHIKNHGTVAHVGITLEADIGAAGQRRIGLIYNSMTGGPNLGAFDIVDYDDNDNYVKSLISVQKSGNIGIGTTSPQSKFHVQSSNGPAILRVESANSEADLSLISDGSGQCVVYSPSGTDDLYFFVGGGNRAVMRANGNVGIGLTNPQETLAVQGNIASAGSVFASCGTLTCSDARFKANATPLPDSLDILAMLQPIRFDWRRSEFPDRNFDDKPQIGFIAQELLEVVPEVVQQGSDGYYSVDYGRLTPVLTAAMQELHADFRCKDAEMAQQAGEIAGLRAALHEKQTQLDVLTARLEKIEAALADSQKEVRP